MILLEKQYYLHQVKSLKLLGVLTVWTHVQTRGNTAGTGEAKLWKGAAVQLTDKLHMHSRLDLWCYLSLLKNALWPLTYSSLGKQCNNQNVVFPVKVLRLVSGMYFGSWKILGWLSTHIATHQNLEPEPHTIIWECMQELTFHKWGSSALVSLTLHPSASLSLSVFIYHLEQGWGTTGSRTT